MGKSVIKGTLILTIFSFFGKGLGAIFRIGLTSILGSYGMGVYQLVFPLLVFFICLSSEGFSVALTVKIAEDKLREKHRSYLRFGSFWSMLLAGLSAMIIFLCCNIISKMQGGKVDLKIYYIIALAIVIISILSLKKSEIRGLEEFKAFSISEIIEDILKVVFGLLFGYLFLPYGIQSAVFGVFLGIILSAVVSYIFLLATTPKHKSLNKTNLPLTQEEKINFIKFSFVSLLSTIVFPAVQFVESAIIIDLLEKAGEDQIIATSFYGISRGVVSSIINLPFFVFASFEILLLPNLARSKTGGVYYKKTKASLMLAVFVSVPFVLLYVLFSNEIILIMFGSTFSQAETIISSNLLKIGSVGILFSAISTILSVIHSSNNKVFPLLISAIVAGVVKIIALVVLVPKLSIYGAEVSSVLYAITFCLVSLIFACKNELFSKPKQILWVIFIWVLIFFIVVVINDVLQRLFISSVLSTIVSFMVVGFGIIIIIGSLFLIFKGRFINFIKRFIGIE